MPSPLEDFETQLVAATFDQTCRPFFYRNLCRQTVFVPVTRNTKGGRGGILEDTDCEIVTSRRGGADTFFAYTNPEMVPSKYSGIEVPFEHLLLEASSSRPVCLNPGQAVTKDFSLSEIAAILTGGLTDPAVLETGILGKTPEAPSEKTRKFHPVIVSLLKDHPDVKLAAGGEFLSSERKAGVWLGIKASNRESWKAAAQDCSILLSTLDETPAAFDIVRVRNVPEDLCSAEVIYQGGGAGEAY